MEFWDMDDRRETRINRNGSEGRGDFDEAIDNVFPPFLNEEFFNNDGGTQQNFAFNDLTPHTPEGKLPNAIVENKRNNNGHSLPESPPDSSSEHPYSPQDGCEAPLNGTDSIYTTLTSNLGPNIYNNLILGSHIVVTDQNGDGLVDGNEILHQDSRLLVTQDVRNSNILSSRMLQNSISSDHTIILSDNVPDNNRHILLPNVQSEQGATFSRPLYEQKEFTDEKHNMVHLTFSPEMENVSRTNINSANINIENSLESSLPNVYTNLQSPCKKRKISQDGNALVKSEPDHCPTAQLSPTDQFGGSVDEDYASTEACLSESQYQCIRFSPFQQNSWHTLCDQNLAELATPHYRVDADKGFNFSNSDDAFVCQKKNHFQITCHVQLLGDAQFVKTPEGLKKISSFHLHFYGVKHDCPSQTIKVEQSQSDRSKKPFHPVPVELVNSQVTKITVGRLHFSETTSNNMRKKGKPNPEQRYFQLVVGLHAHTSNGNFAVISHASQKIIVRASNPGQFESDVELCWQKGQTQDSIFHNGKVGINTDRPDETLVVHGNVKVTGQILHPSDSRAKSNLVELNSADQLENVRRIKVYRYNLKESVASQLSKEKNLTDTGVIAQEVAEILPDAVRAAGDLISEDGTLIRNFLVVDKTRLFMENLGAVKELCKVVSNLETRIDQVERMERISTKLNKLKRGDSLKSNSTVYSSKYSQSSSRCTCSKRHKCKYCEKEEADLCSNKFIQVVIVILVLIMALCLAAITTLYLLETNPRNSIKRNVYTGLELNHSTYSTKRPSVPKYDTRWTTLPPLSSTNSFTRENRDDEINKILQESSPKQQHSLMIGSPDECQAVDQRLDEKFCQIYCCPTQSVPPPFKEQQSVALEKNRISIPIHSNDIYKQNRRRRRHSNELSNVANVDNDLSDDQQICKVIIRGKNFSVPMNQNYLKFREYNAYNFSYAIPISKYMPDHFVNIEFRCNSTGKFTTIIDNCPNELKHYECSPYSNYSDESKSAHKEDLPGSISFEVDMADFQFKVMTYRIGLSDYLENLCDLEEGKLGLEFAVYNFHFYRNCND
ncbi:myelin regulatory factor-like protein isoform X1 [Euwallacea fornicatus]|uniref:myelin regulatory factor-like protein isoform X1 n=1 Tax=Euwallacea fornicatus TaxID=995702 RepID=UPI00338E7A3C